MNTMSARMAYEMRLSGKDDFEIAEELTVTVDEAGALVEEWATSLPTPTNTEARRDEINRVDKWLSRVDAEYIKGALPVDKAVTAFVKLSERRCKLLGLDAPTRAEIEATLHAAVPTSVDDEVAMLAAELGLHT